MRLSMIPPITSAGWLVLLLLIAAAILSIVRVIGWEYRNAVTWHNLRVEVHRLRRERLLALMEEQGEFAQQSPDLVADAMKHAGSPPPGAATGPIGSIGPEDAAPAQSVTAAAA